MPDAPRRRGLKPGQRHAGSFKPGFDPKRNAYLYDGMTFGQIAHEAAPRCIALWRRCVDDEAAPWNVRLRASELIVERAYGKAVSVIDMNVTANRSVKLLTNDELLAIAAAALPPIEGELAVPDAVPTECIAVTP